MHTFSNNFPLYILLHFFYTARYFPIFINAFFERLKHNFPLNKKISSFYVIFLYFVSEKKKKMEKITFCWLIFNNRFFLNKKTCKGIKKVISVKINWGSGGLSFEVLDRWKFIYFCIYFYIQFLTGFPMILLMDIVLMGFLLMS